MLDVFDDIPDSPSENGLSRLQNLFHRRQQAADEVERLKAELQVAEEALRDIEERQFPDLFDEVGVTGFSVGNHKVTVEEKLYGGLPKDPEERAIAMSILKAHGGESLMKMEVSVNFPKGQDEQARIAAALLESAGLNPVVDETIHGSTYQKWAREMLEQGVPLDLKALGLYHRRFIKIK